MEIRVGGEKRVVPRRDKVATPSATCNNIQEYGTWRSPESEQRLSDFKTVAIRCTFEAGRPLEINNFRSYLERTVHRTPIEYRPAPFCVKVNFCLP